MNHRASHRIGNYPTFRERSVQLTDIRFGRCAPVYSKFYRAIFYGGGCMRTHLVLVPVDFSPEQPQLLHSPYDLDVDDWVDKGHPGVVDMAPYFHRVQLAGASRAFMIVKIPQDNLNSIPLNEFLVRKHGIHVHGNVVVLALDTNDNVQGGRKRQRDLVHARLLSHTTSVMCHFLTSEQQDAVFNLLRATSSAVTGSVSAAISRPQFVVGNRDLPRNLNISVPRGAGILWHNFLLLVGAEEGPPLQVRVSMSEAVQDVKQYTLRNMQVSHTLRNEQAILLARQGIKRTIIVTQSHTSSVLAVALSSEWTHQMTLLLGTRVIVVYPQLLNSSRSLPGYTQTYFKPGMSWERFFRRGWWHYASANLLPGAPANCGCLCPFLWRRTFGFAGFGQVSWGFPNSGEDLTERAMLCRLFGAISFQLWVYLSLFHRLLNELLGQTRAQTPPQGSCISKTRTTDDTTDAERRHGL
ncbi:hypothetical protein C8J57DRAFT_1258001 [Mycena rebaudengoi]|nr:hypothetical protein C8J57DRAFT_1258001 [Mycena rebaudengoi]